ncbi:secondary carrier transporter [Lithospermum erythrorhizon]|uniref:Secondary carrier transporter n=1 Tax=Lithospermum erythrorhizon TaxID=34254 RepID=A0AAV3Q2R9_LITER
MLVKWHDPQLQLRLLVSTIIILNIYLKPIYQIPVIRDDGEVYTVDEALGEVGFGQFQVWVLLYAGFGCVAEAMEVMILSFVGPEVKFEWNLSSSQEGLLTTVVFAGMLIGAYCWGVIADKYGRRAGLLSVAIVTTLPAFFSTFSPNYVSLLSLRMVVGLGLGGAPVYTSWFLEFVPKQNRGRWMVVFSTFWTIGTIFETSLAWIILPRLGWRWLLALSSLPAFATLFFYGLTVESPRYLYMQGRLIDAECILRKVATVNKKELPAGRLVAEKLTELHEDHDHEEVGQLLSHGREKDTVAHSHTGLSLLISLFSAKLVKSTLLLWVVFFGNSFAYYGIILLTSELVNENSSCGSIVLLSKPSEDTSLYRDVFITSLAELPGIVIAGITVDNIGRKFSMAIMYMLGCIFLLPLLFHQHEILTVVTLFGARMCIIGTFTIAGVYCPEIYPTSVRTTGVGVASAIGRIGGMICPAVAVGLTTNCHQMSAITLFEVVIIISGISVLFMPHETTGQELIDSLESD